MAALDPSQTLGVMRLLGYAGPNVALSRRDRRPIMAKGQKRSNNEDRKPKKAKLKTIAANASQKGGARGLENLKNS